MPTVRVNFSSEKSANDHYRRNLKRKSCAKPRGPEASHMDDDRRVRPRTEEKGGGKRLGTQQTLFGIFGFVIEGDRGEKRSLPGSFRQGHKQSWRPWSRQQITTKAKIQEKANPIQWVREE